MRLRVLKPGDVILETDVKQVTLPGCDGQLTPMDGHDRMLTILNEGRITYLNDGEGAVRGELDIDGGLAEVTHDSVILFVRSAKEVSSIAQSI